MNWTPPEAIDGCATVASAIDGCHHSLGVARSVPGPERLRGFCRKFWVLESIGTDMYCSAYPFRCYSKAS